MEQIKTRHYYSDFLNSKAGKDMKECFDKIDTFIDKIPSEFGIDYMLLSERGRILLFPRGDETRKENNKEAIYSYLWEITSKVIGLLVEEHYEPCKRMKAKAFRFVEQMEKLCNNAEELKGLYGNKRKWN